MGIRNREGALYIATGVDNTGLYTGRREAMGIIKAMSSQITSFDVFSGIGISAATAFASAAKSAYNFEKEFHKNMLEVATISTQVSGSMADFMNRVLSITQQIPIAAPEAAKALYQIVSAGHDGAAGMQILEVSAKAAVGGLTETATAADAITTILNAYKLSADQAATISDQLFTTVRLGKTDFSQLGTSIAQVAPIAASYGVEIDQVLAAVASLTKQGTPTAQAMTQIRAAIIGTSKVLGDGAFEGRTFQEALAEVAARANGSESKLRELVPEIEAVNGVLGMTGQNAKAAASDLGELQNSTGATEAAFQKMQEDVDNQMKLLSNNIHAALRPMGEAILKNVSEAAQMINKGFETGDVQNSLESLKKLLIGVAGVYVTYKSSVIGASAAEAFHSAKVTVSNNLKSLQSKITGEATLAKEKERVYQEAYTVALERSITEEHRAKISKLNLKAGSQEYVKALSEQALQEKKNADNQVESLTKQVNKNKERLASAQENLEMSHKAVDAAKAEFDAAFAANDLAGVEAAQTKINAAAQREEAASANVATASKKLKTTQSKLSSATIAAETAATRVNTAATEANTAVTNVSTTAKGKLKIATNALWGAMKANPIGAVLTAISLATTVYMVFADKIKAAETAQSRLNKLNKAAADNMAAEKAELGLLLSVAKNELVSKEDRLKAIKKLNEISPEYLGNLSLENLGTKEAAESIEAYTKAIEKNAKMQAAKDMISDKYKKQLEVQKEIEDLENKKRINKGNKVVGDTFGGNKYLYAGKGKDVDYDDKIKNKQKQYDALQSEIDQVLSFTQDEVKKQPIEIPVNIQIASEQANISALLKKKEEIEARMQARKENGLFEDAFDATQLAAVNVELEKANANLEALNQTSSSAIEGETVLQRKLTLTKELAAAEAKLKKLRASDSTATDAEIAEAEKKVEEKKKALKALTGLSEKEGDKSKQEQKKIFADLLVLRIQNQQSEIELMEEGSKKRIAQINLDYDKEIAAIMAKEKEWKDAQGGTLTKEQTVEIRTSFVNAWVKKDKSTTDVNKEQLESEKKAMNEYLIAYGTYQEKRKALTEKYNVQIAKATTEGEKLSLGKELTKSLSDLDIAANKSTSAISLLFGDMSEKAIKHMRAIADEGEKALEFLKNGEWDASAGLELGISEETFKTLKDSPEELEAIAKSIIKIRKEADQSEISFNKISDGLKKVFAAGDDTEKLKKGLAEIESGMNDVVKVGQFLSDTLSNLGDAFDSEVLGKAAEGINVAMDAASSAMSGAQAGAMFGPWGAAAGAAIGLVSSLGSSLAKLHDARHEKKIQRIADQIEVLDRAYDKLGDAIEKAYSVDASELIEQQNRMLEQQKVLIQQQIREEEEKKKTDNDRIKEWKNQLEDIDKTLADNKEKAKDAIFGEDLKSAIDNFANAYAEAWAAGEDRAKSMKDVARNMIKQTMIELIKSSAGLGETVKKIREMILGFLSDGVVDEWEQRELDSYIESETARLDAKYGWADKYMKGDKEIDLGISGDSLADTIVDGLRAGKAGIKDFSGSFEEMMKTAILNSLKTKYLEGPLKEFQKKFRDLSESGGQLTEAEIEELRAMYADIIDGAKVQFDSLKEISGLDFLDDFDNTLKGAFAKASQESIDLIAGQFGAMRFDMEAIRNIMVPLREQLRFIFELQQEGWADVKAIRELTVKIDRNSEQVARNTRLIQDMVDRISESAQKTAESTQKAAESLDSIDNRGIKVKM